MKKLSGIVRNKTANFTNIKKEKQRRKFRFQVVGKDEDQFNSDTNTRISQQFCSSNNNSLDLEEQKTTPTGIYNLAKAKLDKISEIQKKISTLAKNRLSSFKEKQNDKYDETISKLASEATNNLVQSEKMLKQLRRIDTGNASQAKFIKNLELSLAQTIRDVSRNLRQQEKQYFTTIRSYERTSTNSAIELTSEQKRIMTSEQEEMMEEKNDMKNDKIDELVKSINKLSGIYKELNQLVIEQGSIIDRIDVQIQQTYEHTKSAVVHLHGADQAASSPFADKIIKVLVITILLMAIVLGFKFMNVPS